MYQENLRSDLILEQSLLISPWRRLSLYINKRFSPSAGVFTKIFHTL